MTGRGRSPPPAMINLDQYMRAPVRRNTPSSYNTVRHNRLVVDHGRPPVRRVASSSSSGTVADQRNYCKKYSHDSGLSDGSFKRRKHRHNRRVAAGPPSSENDSLHAFREVCERTLKQQQTQISRVAAMCEQLAVRQSHVRDSSDLSTTTGTRSDRQDKHNRSPCKTYKIIMRKLEELNRVLSPPSAPSSGSLTVVDKLVATDDLPCARNMVINDIETAHVRTISPYRASIVMESVVQTDFPADRHPSTNYRPVEFRQCSRHQCSGEGNVLGGVWRTLRSYLILCFPHMS